MAKTNLHKLSREPKVKLAKPMVLKAQKIIPVIFVYEEGALFGKLQTKLKQASAIQTNQMIADFKSLAMK